MSKLTVRLRDVGNEFSSVTARIADQSGADTWTDLAAVAASFLAAVGGVTLCNPITASFFQYTDENADAPAVDDYANRELGMRFFFHSDVTFEKGYLTVPGPDLANIDMESDGDTADLTDSEVAALVTWIEANVLIQGNAVSVDRAVLVGRAN